MAYDEHLGERIHQVLKDRNAFYEARKMMGGLVFMVENKMCVGIVKDMLMARVAPEVYEESLERDGARPMDFTGRAMKGFIYVEPDGMDMQKDLEYWVDLALEFNPRAKASPKRKKKA